MSWSYSGAPADSLKDEVRFLVQDVDPDVPLLSDEEISYLLSVWMPRYDSPIYTASIAAGVIARRFAGLTTISADGVSVDVSGVSDRYTAVAAQLREDYAAEGAPGGLVLLDNILAGTEWDSSIEPLEFSIGLFDSPWVGPQNYGGRRSAPSYGYSDNYQP